MNQEQWESLRDRYLRGELSLEERASFEAHMEAEGLGRTDIEADLLLTGGLRHALDALYPADLEARTMARVRSVAGGEVKGAPEKAGPGRGFGRVLTWLREGEFRIPAPAAIAAAVLLVVTGGIALRTLLPAGGDAGTALPGGLESAHAGVVEAEEAAEEEVHSLLKRARTLLLALATAGPDREGRYDLSAEEALSRDLIVEVRMLESSRDLAELEERQDVLDLVRDLEAILLDVSTWQGVADSDRLAVVRGGIEDRSLIFRLNTYAQEFGGD